MSGRASGVLHAELRDKQHDLALVLYRGLPVSDRVSAVLYAELRDKQHDAALVLYCG